MLKEPLPRLEITKKDGVMTGNFSGERLMVLPTRFWGDAVAFLRQAYGDSIDLTLTRFANEYGARFARGFIAKGLSPEQSVAILEELATFDGWGTVKVTGDMKGGTSLEVEVNGCAFCPEGENDTCTVLAGIATGIAGVTYRREFECSHARGKGPDDGKCMLRLTEAPKKRSRDWKTKVYFPWFGKDSGE